MFRLVVSWNILSGFYMYSCGIGYVIFGGCVSFCLCFFTRLLEWSSKHCFVVKVYFFFLLDSII